MAVEQGSGLFEESEDVGHGYKVIWAKCVEVSG
jgi:hypothetical protein